MLQCFSKQLLRWVRQEDGIEILEFVGLFPLVLLTIMIIWQFMLVGYTAIIVASAAREGARATAVREDCYNAVVRASPGWDDSTRQIQCQVNGDTVIVTVKLQIPKTQLPLIGSLPGYPWMPSTAVMRYEPPY